MLHTLAFFEIQNEIWHHIVVARVDYFEKATCMGWHGLGLEEIACSSLDSHVLMMGHLTRLGVLNERALEFSTNAPWGSQERLWSSQRMRLEVLNYSVGRLSSHPEFIVEF